jgi:SAM-dependent methyltransferase
MATLGGKDLQGVVHSPRDALCAWCGAPARPTGAGLAVCGACGSATTFPVPGELELGAAYAGWYRPSAGRFAAGGDWLLRRSRAQLAQRLERRAPPGPILDVGSGDGTLLDALHQSGRDAVGLERESSRPDVRPVEITSFEERRGEWAAVVFWHSLEHLREPAAALDHARELLAPGGLLAVAVPNLDSWQARLLAERWFALDLPRHLVHLPAATLTEGLKARGFRIERVSYWRAGQVVFGWLHGLVGCVPGRPDLYAAIRRPPARRDQLSLPGRAFALGAAVLLWPLAALLAGAEIAARKGGSVYVEARRQ